MALLDSFRAYRDTALANRPPGTPESNLVSAQVMRDTFEALCDALETILANPTWSVNGLALSLEIIVATADGQTTFNQALPAGTTPVLVKRGSGDIIRKNLDWTYNEGTRVFGVVNPDPAVVKDELYFALCQSAAVVQAGAAPAPPATGNAMVSVADVAALLNPLTPSNTYAYTPVADDGSITEVRKVAGQLYESMPFIPYVANP